MWVPCFRPRNRSEFGVRDEFKPSFWNPGLRECIASTSCILAIVSGTRRANKGATRHGSQPHGQALPSFINSPQMPSPFCAAHISQSLLSSLRTTGDLSVRSMPHNVHLCFVWLHLVAHCRASRVCCWREFVVRSLGTSKQYQLPGAASTSWKGELVLMVLHFVH